MSDPDLTFPNPSIPGAQFALWKGWDAQERLCEHLGSKAWARWPHHTSSLASLIGSGSVASGYLLWKLQPGEIMLAGAGALCLHDLPEFKRDTVAAMATAWRAGAVEIRLSDLVIEVPVRCSVYATAQACPCGFGGGSSKGVCGCTPEMLKRWRTRIDAAVAAFRGR